MRPLALAWAGVAALVVGGCSTAEYYWQGISGQLDLLGRAQPIGEVLEATQDPVIKRKLELVLAIREYASRELGLPQHLRQWPRRREDFGESGLAAGADQRIRVFAGRQARKAQAAARLQ